MKRIISLILAMVMLVGMMTLTSCGKIDPAKDWDTIKANGQFVVGCTEFEPMNYYDASNKLIGFDTEYAQAVAEYLGVEVKFEMITWSNKYMELDAGKLDCIWNGFTSNSSDDGVARSQKVDFAVGYATNYQCIVMNKSATAASLADLSGLSCAVEAGSAGEAYAKTVTSEDKIVPKDAQIDAFTELKGGQVDFIVVDVLLANRTCGKGDFGDYEIKFEATGDLELYGIGCRKGSSFTAKINEATKHLINTGKLQELAEKYGVPLSEGVLALKDAD